jgi:hypothetical protein
VTTCSDFEVEGAVYLLFLLGRVTGEWDECRMWKDTSYERR